MWVRTAASVLLLAAGLHAAPERPTAPLSCPKSQGLFSHPTDCHKFLHCDHGHPYVKDCPANLHFNAKLMVCDWPENAGCVPGTPTDPPTPDVPPEPDMECDCECCLKPNANDCTTYYICKDGKAYLAQCATGLVFNPNIENCDLPSNYECEVTSPAPQPTTTPKVTTPKSDFNCPTADGLFPNPKDCHTFYHCSNGIAYLKDCPANLDFDPVAKRCEWPEKAGCRYPATTVTSAVKTTPKVTTPKSDFDCPTADGLFPNPKDCHTFYHCSNGIAYLKDCPANLDFDPVAKRCEWPEKAGCRYPATTTTKSTPKTTTPKGTTPKSDFDCPTRDGLFPNPKDCHTFYHCSHGTAYLKDCPANLDFNPVLKVCDWPEHAGCRYPVTTKTTPVVPTRTTPDAGFDCPSSSGLFPNPKDCHTFFQCAHGRAYLMHCPANLEFNPVLKVCDWPEHAGCSNKTTPTTPTVRTTTPPRPTPTQGPGFDCPTSNGLFPNPKDCHSFYHCSNGHAYLKDCPANLEFNPVLLVCDWPEHAGCGGKPTPRPPTTTPGPRPTPNPDIICPDDTCVCRLPDPKDCSGFYECHDGQAYHESCPEGLYFNATSEVCDLPSNVDCEIVTTQTPTTTTPPPLITTTTTEAPAPTTTTTEKAPTTTEAPATTTTEAPAPCTFPCSRRDGKYANPLNCGSYFQCEDGEATVHFCPYGKHFNTGTNACDAPASEGCCGDL